MGRKLIGTLAAAVLMLCVAVSVAEEQQTVYMSLDSEYGYILLDDGTAEITQYCEYNGILYTCPDAAEGMNC